MNRRLRTFIVLLLVATLPENSFAGIGCVYVNEGSSTSGDVQMGNCGPPPCSCSKPNTNYGTNGYTIFANSLPASNQGKSSIVAGGCSTCSQTPSDPVPEQCDVGSSSGNTANQVFRTWSPT